MPQELNSSYKKPLGNRRNKSAGEFVHLTGFAGDKTAGAELGVSFPARRSHIYSARRKEYKASLINRASLCRKRILISDVVSEITFVI